MRRPAHRACLAAAATGAGRRLWRSKLALGAALVLLVIFTAAVAADRLAPYDPADGNIGDRLLPPSWPGARAAAVCWEPTRSVGTC